MAERVFVIAECCSSWRFGSDHLANAFRMIEAAKECGADAAKLQWTSDPVLMAQRRHGKREEFDILAYPFEWLEKLKAKCDEVGIEFMCTVFIEKDIATIAPLVRRYKIASAESSDEKFIIASSGKNRIISHAFGSLPTWGVVGMGDSILHCVCAYPTPINQFNVKRIVRSDEDINRFDGISDHTTSVLSGAVAVGAGAKIIEKHVRLNDTPKENPDYPHSLIVNIYEDAEEITHGKPEFEEYVHNIREAEAMMGSGVNEPMECEKSNIGRRVTP